MSPQDAIDIAIENGYNANQISDGYHTFGELYEHRVALFIALCRVTEMLEVEAGMGSGKVWRSRLHSDGTSYEDWFIMGIGTGKGLQITYHLPIDKWNETYFAETLDKAPEFDGHTSEDVLNRLKSL